MRINPKTIKDIGTVADNQDVLLSSPDTNQLQKMPLANFMLQSVTSEVVDSATGYTTVVIDVPAASILTMGTSPIELVAAQGDDTYFDAQVFVEFTPGATPYDFTGVSFISVSINGIKRNVHAAVFQPLLGAYPFEVTSSTPASASGAVAYTDATSSPTNVPITLTTFEGLNPTLGDGTARVIVRYKVRTFGA